MSERKPHALVTGASSGLGAALAQRLAADGYVVYLAARRAQLLAEMAALIREAGGEAHAMALDVSDVDLTARKVVDLDEACGGLDLVVANAGVSGMQSPRKLTWERSRETLMINLMGAAATLLPLVTRMLSRGRGHLVGISSLAADMDLPISAVYGASKIGLTRLLLSLRPALVPRGVHVTVVHPGFVATPMTAGARFAMPFLLDAESATAIIYRAIRRKRALVRFPWPMVWFIRLAALLPRALRERVMRWLVG